MASYLGPFRDISQVPSNRITWGCYKIQHIWWHARAQHLFLGLLEDQRANGLSPMSPPQKKEGPNKALRETPMVSSPLIRPDFLALLGGVFFSSYEGLFWYKSTASRFQIHHHVIFGILKMLHPSTSEQIGGIISLHKLCKLMAVNDSTKSTRIWK